MTSPTDIDRSRLRRELIARRNAHAPGFRARAAWQILRFIERSNWLLPRSAIGLYVATGAEPDTGLLRNLASSRQCRVYLPRISNYRERRMLMCLDTGAALVPNRFGIPEPPPTTTVGVTGLRTVFLPVVGFDAAGNRLGMGAGYYDRYLGGARPRPRLVGVAFESARVPLVPALPHDVPLDAIVTEAGIELLAAQD